jgi:hypothetical protein
MQQKIATFEEQVPGSFPKQASGLLVASGLRVETGLPSKQQATALLDHGYNQARSILSGEWRVVQDLLMLEWKVLSPATSHARRG